METPVEYLPAQRASLRQELLLPLVLLDSFSLGQPVLPRSFLSVYPLGCLPTLVPPCRQKQGQQEAGGALVLLKGIYKKTEGSQSAWGPWLGNLEGSRSCYRCTARLQLMKGHVCLWRAGQSMGWCEGCENSFFPSRTGKLLRKRNYSTHCIY